MENLRQKLRRLEEIERTLKEKSELEEELLKRWEGRRRLGRFLKSLKLARFSWHEPSTEMKIWAEMSPEEEEQYLRLHQKLSQ